MEEIAGKTQSKFTLPTEMMLRVVKGAKEVKPCVPSMCPTEEHQDYITLA
jgi:hypothetical protein